MVIQKIKKSAIKLNIAINK